MNPYDKHEQYYVTAKATRDGTLSALTTVFWWSMFGSGVYVFFQWMGC